MTTIGSLRSATAIAYMVAAGFRRFYPPPIRQFSSGGASFGCTRPTDLSRREENFYDVLIKYLTRDSEGRISVRLTQALEEKGLQVTDPRLQPAFKELRKVQLTESNNSDEYISKFKEAIDSKALSVIEKALNGKLIIPDFQDFKNQIQDIYTDCIDKNDGEIASYIPRLAEVDSNLWGVSVCTVDGQRYHAGDSNTEFTIQSGFKCFAYALAVDEYGSDVIHKHIGMEPSGTNFNNLQLSENNKPHNPMINSGALVLCSILKPELNHDERLKFMLEKLRELCGKPKDLLQVDTNIFESEMATADVNLALLHYMKHMKALHKDEIRDVLHFYTKLCSIKINCSHGAVMAATLANGGYCPNTGERLLKHSAVRDTLALMQSCGMYDRSGEFSFYVGLPAKSGVSGVIFVAVPNVMGICLYSPRIDKYGHSIKGLHFCKKLVEKFNFHNCDSLLVRQKDMGKVDPRRKTIEQKAIEITSLMYAAKAGSLSSIKRYSVMDWVDMSQCNYDGRTPLHVAAAEGHYEVVHYLVKELRVLVDPIDRWSRTPLDDAITFKREKIVKLLKSHGAKFGTEL